jgi:hypothetical protein
VHPRINLDKLVARIELDINSLHWFAAHGRVAVLAAIDLARTATGAPHPLLDFLERHCCNATTAG